MDRITRVGFLGTLIVRVFDSVGFRFVSNKYSSQFFEPCQGGLPGWLNITERRGRLIAALPGTDRLTCSLEY